MAEKNFSDLDANYHSQEINGVKLMFQNAFEAPFRLEGFPYLSPDGIRSRLPLETAKKCDMQGVLPMSMQGAGEVLRFRTDSTKIGIYAEFGEVFSTNIRCSSCGFDLYRGNGPDKAFVGNRVIPAGKETIEALYELPPEKTGMEDYTLYFPLHCRTDRMKIGIESGCSLEKPTPYPYEKPILFYGSSITNCAAVTRPGVTYPARIGRMLNTEVINMGFSGSCRGELVVADEIAKLDLAQVVLEYDHNAPSAEFLRNTHERFFKHLRALRPDLPILMISKPDFNGSAADRERRRIVCRTWMNARESGDTLAEFLDGEILFAGPARTDCTTDGCHPNDQGTERMAIQIVDRLKTMPRA